MGKKKTTCEFIEQAKFVHGDRYKYSKVDYIDSKNKIVIECKIHGEVEVVPTEHLKGRGCIKCSNESRFNKRKLTTEQFVEKAKEKHGDKYDYSLVDYINSTTKIKLICKSENHYFEQSPSNHLYGFGCIFCARITQGNSKRKNKYDFIKKAKKLHGDTYSYENVNYIDNTTAVNITCKHHGDYSQTPNAHLSKKGCMKCSRIYNSFIREDYVKMAKGREVILYLLRCWNEEEEFYKIGKTFISIKQRYKTGAIPYNYEIVDTRIADALTIHLWEVGLHKKYGIYNYKPKKWFGGYTECYKNLPLINTLEI